MIPRCIESFDEKMGKFISLQRQTKYRDETGQIRECKISFSLNIQESSEIAGSAGVSLPADPEETPADPAISEDLSCNEILTRNARHETSRCCAFKRRISFHQHPLGRKRNCTVRFSLKCGGDSQQRRPNFSSSIRMLGGLEVCAPLSCFRRQNF
jgi:hypothetical protein